MITALLAQLVPDAEQLLSNAPVSTETVPFERMALVTFAVDAGIVIIVFGMLLCIYRLIRGPHLADRSIAADTFAIHLIGLVILYTIRTGATNFIDGILVLSLLSFAGTVAVAQYIARPRLLRRRGGQVGDGPVDAPPHPDDTHLEPEG